jgi:hypothetical protein
MASSRVPNEIIPENFEKSRVCKVQQIIASIMNKTDNDMDRFQQQILQQWMVLKTELFHCVVNESGEPLKCKCI